jgi:MATE family multidrug resistance protein
MSVRLSQFSNQDSPIEISPGSEGWQDEVPLTWSQEIWLQLTEASPLLCTNLSINLLSTISLAFVGQLGLDQLAAICLATVLMTGSLVLILGHTNALSNFCQDAYENAVEYNEDGKDELADKSFREVGLWLQLGSLLPLVLFMPLVVVVWGQSGKLLEFCGA